MNGKIGATRVQIDDQLDRFKDHAAANARKQANWDASFKNWMRKAKDFGKCRSACRHVER